LSEASPDDDNEEVLGTYPRLVFGSFCQTKGTYLLILNQQGIMKRKRGVPMRAKIDHEGCISCGLCPETCPEVFQFADDGKADVIIDPVPDGLEGQVEEAADGCPVSVISYEK
jgi:ferredoxin